MVNENNTSQFTHLTSGGYEHPIYAANIVDIPHRFVRLGKWSCRVHEYVKLYVMYCSNYFRQRKRIIPLVPGGAPFNWRPACMDPVTKTPLNSMVLCPQNRRIIETCYRLAQCPLFPGVVSRIASVSTPTECSSFKDLRQGH